jgi:hypothetical protein
MRTSRCDHALLLLAACFGSVDHMPSLISLPPYRLQFSLVFTLLNQFVLLQLASDVRERQSTAELTRRTE